MDELIAEKSHALKLTTDELAKITQELQTPLTDATIQPLLLFSVTFQERLEGVERSFEGRRKVVDGLDVTVTVLRKDGEIYLKLRSILRPYSMTILLAPQRHSWVANADPWKLKLSSRIPPTVVEGIVRLSVITKQRKAA